MADIPSIVFSCASFSDVPTLQAAFTNLDDADAVLDYLRSKDVIYLDTARGYPFGASGGSERLLGTLGVGHTGFIVDTKMVSWAPGSHTADKIASSIDASLETLKMSKVHIMYLHSPDRATPFEITCRAMDKAYREGKFEKFGLSNYTAKEVEQIVDICDKEGLVKPSVYQGKYDVLIRSGETALFPLLRQHKISIYAYSPFPAGLFSGKTTKESLRIGGSRWDTTPTSDPHVSAEEFVDNIFEACDDIHTAAIELEGVDGYAVALRWIVYHSQLVPELGDKIILGTSSLEQLKEDLDSIDKGPLSTEMVEALDEIWEFIEDTAPNYHR